MLKIKKFEASWCKHCPAMSKVLKEVVKDFDNVIIETIDAEEDDDASVFYNVRSLPTCILIKDNKEVYRFMGTRNKGEVKKIIEDYV